MMPVVLDCGHVSQVSIDKKEIPASHLLSWTSLLQRDSTPCSVTSNNEGRRWNTPPSVFTAPPSAFTAPPSSFAAHPSSFSAPTSSFTTPPSAHPGTHVWSEYY